MFFVIDSDHMILSVGDSRLDFRKGHQNMAISEEQLREKPVEEIQKIFEVNCEPRGVVLESREELIAEIISHFDWKKEALMSKAQADKKAEAQEPSARDTKRQSRIVLKTEANPKREGTKAHERFNLYFKDGVETVDDFIKAGGTMADINYDLDKEYIELQAPAS